MSVVPLERSRKGVPAFFKPQDSPVAMSELELGAWLHLGPDFGERTRSLRNRFGKISLRLIAADGRRVSGICICSLWSINSENPMNEFEEKMRSESVSGMTVTETGEAQSRLRGGTEPDPPSRPTDAIVAVAQRNTSRKSLYLFAYWGHYHNPGPSEIGSKDGLADEGARAGKEAVGVSVRVWLRSVRSQGVGKLAAGKTVPLETPRSPLWPTDGGFSAGSCSDTWLRGAGGPAFWKEGGLSGASPPGFGGERREAKRVEPEGPGAKLAMERQHAKRELEGWGEGAFASSLLAWLGYEKDSPSCLRSSVLSGFEGGAGHSGDGGSSSSPSLRILILTLPPCTVDDRVTRVAWLNRSTILYAGNDKWSIDNRVVILSNTKTQYSIKIHNVDIYDEGPYTCSVQTDNHPKTSRVHLIVQVPPQIVNISSDITVNEGSSVTLMCLAFGRPEPTVTWRHLSGKGPGFASEDEYLEITGITREQSGEYECSAVNDVAVPDVRKVKVTVNCE
ncbi:PREDICTED: uncharacterized protein LOC104350293, partial [Leptosomus discolor]|uniref:uncharacterized protein LOC104350293 n=1 Tax=Leptosomus discolor TaxID=188344 RepID=UPI0005226CEF